MAEEVDQRYTEQSQAIHIERHSRYVAGGGCASVHWSKAWCNARSTGRPGGMIGHIHFAPGDGQPGIKWSDAEASGCPCPQR
jgi:hypothetical protein